MPNDSATGTKWDSGHRGAQPRAPAPYRVAETPAAFHGPRYPDYDRQEDKEPLAALREVMGNERPKDSGHWLRMEWYVQFHIDVLKHNSCNHKSSESLFRWNAERRTPTAAAEHCVSRCGDSGISRFLRWHYYLFLHFSSGRNWLERAVPLMLETAAKTRDPHRASSYILSAHNLNRWYKRGMSDMVLTAALRFVRERTHNPFTHFCARIVADLEGDPAVLHEVHSAMLRATSRTSGLDAAHCSQAAALLSEGGTPAWR